MNALVIGGAGFIGSHLVERLLSAGDTVTVVDDLSRGSLRNLFNVSSAAKEKRFSFVQLDIRDRDMNTLMRRVKPEVVFHLAGFSDATAAVASPPEDIERNVFSSLSIFDNSLRVDDCRLIIASTTWIYGESEDLPIGEEHVSKPNSPYGVSMMMIEEYANYYERAYGLRSTTVAMPSVYGPRQVPSCETYHIARFAETMTEGNQCLINGDGEQTRDYLFVYDAVDALVKAVDYDGHKRINIGTGREVSHNEAFKLMCEVFRHKVDPRYENALPGDIKRNCVDPSYAREALGWTASMNLEEGLRRTAAWSLENAHRK